MAKIGNYQQKLHDIYEFSDGKNKTSENYHNFYIHSLTFENDVTIYSVRFLGSACYYSKSIEQVKRRIKRFKKAFDL